jgi:hypothetical protein
MIIELSPCAANRETTTVKVSGLVITIDDIEYDLSVIPEGGSAEWLDENAKDPVFIGVVTREKAKILYFYDVDKAIPDQSRNVEDYTFEVTEGEVPCPIVWKEIT